MRSLPSILTSEIAKEVFSIGHLIKIVLYDTATQTDVPLYYTDKEMDVVCDLGDGTGEHTWLSRGIEFSDGQQSLSPKVDSITFEMDNVALEMSSYVQNYETRGKACTIYRAAFDSYLQVIGVAILFPGILDRVEIDQQRARFEVLSTFARWNMRTPRRKHAAQCFWSFKSSECGYTTGAYTSCDKPWDACVDRARTVSFGGFRWTKDIEEKKVFWGRLPNEG